MYRSIMVGFVSIFIATAQADTAKCESGPKLPGEQLTHWNSLMGKIIDDQQKKYLKGLASYIKDFTRKEFNFPENPSSTCVKFEDSENEKKLLPKTVKQTSGDENSRTAKFLGHLLKSINIKDLISQTGCPDQVDRGNCKENRVQNIIIVNVIKKAILKAIEGHALSAMNNTPLFWRFFSAKEIEPFDVSQFLKRGKSAGIEINPHGYKITIKFNKDDLQLIDFESIKEQLEAFADNYAYLVIHVNLVDPESLH